jgi:hypothetical protein
MSGLRDAKQNGACNVQCGLGHCSSPEKKGERHGEAVPWNGLEFLSIIGEAAPGRPLSPSSNRAPPLNIGWGAD